MYFQHDFYLASKLVRRHQNPHQAFHRTDALEASRSQAADRHTQTRFYRLYPLRNLLFRLIPGLAKGWRFHPRR